LDNMNDFLDTLGINLVTWLSPKDEDQRLIDRVIPPQPIAHSMLMWTSFIRT
jgi:hypothetical protein